MIANMPQHLRDTALDKVKLVAPGRVHKVDSSKEPPGYSSHHYTHYNRFSWNVSVHNFCIVFDLTIHRDMGHYPRLSHLQSNGRVSTRVTPV